MPFPTVELSLPAWMDAVLSDRHPTYPEMADRMALVIELARRNVDAATGGPFGAAIFEARSGRLVAPGVNRVLPGNCSVAHAEITAIMLAQKIYSTYDLGGDGMPAMELVSSTEPCAMCLGAVVWSGVRRLVCAARDEDARAIGFDEGPKPKNWVAALENRGIVVVRDRSRMDAVGVLEHYVNLGGVIYNSRQRA
ncbi:MAG TPA: nucleoside deaminase [Desulfosarcina sp.]|nr:nucleoside deaminase [Desulfosarcina sp.]